MIVRPPSDRPLWLASRSERRHRLLESAGIEFNVAPAAIDDGRLQPGAVDPAHWVMALAYLKARWVADALRQAAAQRVGTVLGADTVCACDGRVLGQPPDAIAAREMLDHLRNATHTTLTGVCLIALADGRRWLGVDRAVVKVGAIGDDELDRYIASEAWRGKAGGYNLEDRIDAGWPLTCDGDPTTVMGLPMTRLAPCLAAWRAAS